MDFSDFVIYADESGDHSLSKVDANYPIFVLSLCVFKKAEYVSRVVPSIQRLKFKWFGHDAVVLHERDIRKQIKPFEFLNIHDDRLKFMEDLTDTLRQAPMRVIASVIDKDRLNSDLFPNNPYHLALRFGLESAYRILKRHRQADRLTHCIFETRGHKEDDDLELEFRRIIGGANIYRRTLNCFDIRLVDKRANSSGLQLADLTARPIGLSVVRPDQPNRAFDTIRPKMLLGKSKTRSALAVKVFP